MIGRARGAAGVGGTLADVDTPALLIDAAVLEHNLATLARLLAGSPIRYRPHTKTHKSPIIAQMQMAAGAHGVCCAKLGEAQILAAGGCPNILVTSPVVGEQKIGALAILAESTRTSVVVDHPDNVRDLEEAFSRAGLMLDVLIEVDVGQGRCGVRDTDAARRLADLVTSSRALNLVGLQGYQGSIQLEQGYQRRRAATVLAHERLSAFSSDLEDEGYSVDVRTGGGTGTLAIDLALSGLSELQPGSYVFMDTAYESLEWSEDPDSRPPFNSALSVLATVISRPSAEIAIVDAGLKALSSDGGIPRPLTHEPSTFTFAGDEHGRLDFDGICPLELGAKVQLMPSHCDTTVNLYDTYTVTRSQMVEAVWDVAARGATN